MTKRTFLVALITSLVLVNLLTSTAFAMESFVDVPTDHRYYEDIMWAKEKGLINGFKDGTFKPDEPIKKGELATIFWKLWGKWFTEEEAKIVKNNSLFNLLNIDEKDPLFIPAHYAVFGIGVHFFEPNYVTQDKDYMPVDLNGMYLMKYDNVTQWEFIYGLDKWRASFMHAKAYENNPWTSHEDFLKVNNTKVTSHYAFAISKFLRTQRDEFDKQYFRDDKYEKAFNAYKGGGTPYRDIQDDELSFIWGVVILQVVGLLPEELSDEDIEYDKPVTRAEVLHALRACENHYRSFGYDMNLGQPDVFMSWFKPVELVPVQLLLE